jgi:hypothetical protein
VLAFVLAMATCAPGFAMCGDGHHMSCCETEEGCHTASFTRSCCGPQPVSPAASGPASEGPGVRVAAHPSLPAALVQARGQGALTRDVRLAFELELLKLAHDPPYLRNGTLLI